MNGGKLMFGVIGGLVALVAAGLLVGGGGLLWAHATQRNANGFFTSPTVVLSTETYALTSTDIDLGSRPGEWLPSGRPATVRVDVESPNASPVFVGIGPEADVEAYLLGVARAEITGIGPEPADVSYRTSVGNAPLGLPSEKSIWVASAEGSGSQSLTWDLERGDWMVVIMNADATQGVTAGVSAGARTELLIPVGFGLLLGGLLFAATAAALMLTAIRQPAAAAVIAGGPTLVRSSNAAQQPGKGDDGK